jgi:RimJ/RimL family protein N-acetyltransferase
MQRVVGFVHTCRSRDDDADDRIGELTSIYLRPDLWGRGVGSRLHEAAVAALAADFQEATLWVLDGNTRSRAFYERKGWQPDGTVKRDTIGDAEVVELRYRRPLDGVQIHSS